MMNGYGGWGMGAWLMMSVITLVVLAVIVVGVVALSRRSVPAALTPAVAPAGRLRCAPWTSGSPAARSMRPSTSNGGICSPDGEANPIPSPEPIPQSGGNRGLPADWAGQVGREVAVRPVSHRGDVLYRFTAA